MKDFIAWIRPSFEDGNHSASYRRISVYVHLWLIMYMIIGHRIKTGFELSAFEILTVSFLLQIGIISAQNIITFFGRDKAVITKEGDPQITQTVTTDKVIIPDPPKNPD